VKAIDLKMELLKLSILNVIVKAIDLNMELWKLSILKWNC